MQSKNNLLKQVVLYVFVLFYSLIEVGKSVSSGESLNDMNLINRAFSLFLCFILAAVVASAAPLIPLQKGMLWIYEGTVEWQERNEIKSEKIRLTTEIIEVFANRKARIAVVRDFPSELVQYENGRLPRYSVLIETGANIYHLPADNKTEALHLARGFLRKPAYSSRDLLLFYPLLKCEHSRIQIEGLDLRRKFKCEQSSRRTNPDIETIDFVRGVGIIRYYYEHFGTTALVNIELKEVRFPKKIRRKGKLKPKTAFIKT